MLTPSSRRADGSRLSRRATLAAGVAVVTASAGCTGFFDDADGPDDDLAGNAPADASVLAHLEVAAVTDASDVEADTDAEDVLEDLATVEGDHVETATSDLEARTGLDPLAADELLVFGDDDPTADGGDEDEDEDGDLLLAGDWDAIDVQASLEETTGLEYGETEYEGEPVLYEPEGAAEAGDDGDGGETDVEDPPLVGDLRDGRFAIGSGPSVRSVLEVAYGDADPLAGPVRDAYDDARGGQLTVAAEPAGELLPEEYAALLSGLNLEVLDEIEAVGRRYETVDAGIALEAGLHVGSEDDAAELETVVGGALAALAELDAAFADAREDVAVDREGTVVAIEYAGEAEVVFDLIDEV